MESNWKETENERKDTGMKLRRNWNVPDGKVGTRKLLETNGKYLE